MTLEPLPTLTLIILLLIIIFIFYIFNLLNVEEYRLINSNTVDFGKIRQEKMISYFTEYLEVKDNSAYVIYYNLPVNSIYWTIGFYKDNNCINSVNMGKYRTTEKDDILAIIVGRNKNAVYAAEKEITKEHDKKYPYKILKYHHLSIKNDYYVKFESYSNKFINYDIKIKIRKYEFDNLKYQEFENQELSISEMRKCEDLNLFNKAKNMVLSNLDIVKKMKVNCNTKELNNSIECFTNRSEVVDGNSTYHIFACDHFKTRAAFHGHLIFYNAETDEPIQLEITSEISDSFNQKGSIAIRSIEFKPVNIKSFYVVEYIYYDYVTGNKVNPNTCIPFQFYQKVN